MVTDEDKTKEQLMSELVALLQRVAGLETLETERKQAEEALRESEEKYRNLFELVPIGITMLDMKGVILYCNSVVYNKGGYTEGEFTGKHFSKIASVRVKDIPTFIRVFNSIVRRKIPKPFEAIYQRKDGTTGWTELNIGLIKVGGKRRILVMQHDITERKQVEEALLESEERYRALVNLGGAVGEATVMLQDTEQGDAIQTFVSKEWPHITGYSQKELLGMSFLDLLNPIYHEASL